MKYFVLVLLAAFALLAVTSGISKVMQVPQEVAFFGKYGLTGWGLSIFGVVQILGGIALLWGKTRLLGAAVISVSFKLSAVLLVLDGSIAMALLTIILSAVVAILALHLQAQRLSKAS